MLAFFFLAVALGSIKRMAMQQLDVTSMILRNV